MKYWFYSEGNILGPYAPAELLSLPAFGEGSLVCPETSTGDDPGDWKAADRVAEIASAMSVGIGSVLSSREGGISGLYELETGLSSAVGASYFESRNGQPYGYEDLLNTIDEILASDKGTAAPAEARPAPDYEMLDRFDIRLSKIQEELEAARWEKNLLLEKIRAKESEELKSRDRIAELEEKLKGALEQTGLRAKESEELKSRDRIAGLEEKLKGALEQTELREKEAEELKNRDRIAEPEEKLKGALEQTGLRAKESEELKSRDRIAGLEEKLKGALEQTELREKEAEELKNMDRIAEPEEKLKGALEQTGLREKELAEARRLEDEAARTEALKKTGELKKEELADRTPEPASPAAPPAEERKVFKSIKPSREISFEKSIDAGAASPQSGASQGGDSADKDKGPIASRRFKSLGRSPAAVIPVSGEEHKGSAPGSESYSAPAEAAQKDARQPYAQQPAPQVQPQSAWQPQPGPVQPLRQPYAQQPAPQAQPQSAWQPQPGPVQPLQQPYAQQPAPQAQPQSAWQPQPGPVQLLQQPYARQTEPQTRPQSAWQPQPGPVQPLQQPYARQTEPQTRPQNAWQPQPGPVQQLQQPYAQQTEPQTRPQNAWQPQPGPAQPDPTQYSWQPQAQPAPVQPVRQPYAQQTEPQTQQQTQSQNAWQWTTSAPSATVPASALKPEPAPAGIFAGDRTERPTAAQQKYLEELAKKGQSSKKGRGKMAVIATLILFGAMVAGGLGYLFFGGGGSLSEFSRLNSGGAEKTKKSSFSSQADPGAEKTGTETGAAEETREPAADQTNIVKAQPALSAAVKPAFEAASNENTSNALKTVKNYKLSGGRGTVAGWFANSFLSNSAGGSNEEWSATNLHGDIFVVQYRLLRPKQDPLVYQFEVDIARKLIVRGINNSAIELLDFSTGTTAGARYAPKRKVRASAPRAGKARGIPVLPLPDEPAAKPAQEEPTGFETVAPEGNEKVKYLVAQESDEELF